MVAPFVTENDVKLGNATANGFTLEVNGYDAFECTYSPKYEKERFKKRPKITCYPYYYINVHYAPGTTLQVTGLELAKRAVARKLNEDFEYKNKRD